MRLTINNNWNLTKPISAICFDCDGTLSAIEGINELARYSNVTTRVKALTSIAMSQTGINPGIYQERLALVNPMLSDLITLSKDYFEKRAPDIEAIIQLYQRLNKSVYIVSAGVNPSVQLFGEALKIPKKNIFAVDLEFNAEGQYLKFDHTSPLIHNDGKRLIIADIKKQHDGIVHIGDGLNDVASFDLVTRFIGFGGFYYRQNISDLCQFYIHTVSLTAMLPLSLTKHEYTQLTDDEKNLYHRGLTAIEEGNVKVSKE